MKSMQPQLAHGIAEHLTNLRRQVEELRHELRHNQEVQDQLRPCVTKYLDDCVLRR